MVCGSLDCRATTAGLKNQTMAKDLKTAAKEALDFNKQLNKVYVTVDGVAFINKNDAVNHAYKLDDKKVEVFERGNNEATAPASGEPAKPALNSKDTIKVIEKATSEQAIRDLIAGDTRSTVLTAADKRIAQLKQEAIDAQSAAADEALKQRQNANPVEGEAETETETDTEAQAETETEVKTETQA